MKYLPIFLIILSPLTGYSQESTPPENDRNVEIPEAERTAPTSEESGSDSDFEVFQPSEDISEDLAVPFPTDI